MFRHPNPGRAIGDAIGIPASATSVLTTWGGNTPIAFVGELGDRLARGEADMIVMVGGETGLTAPAPQAGLPSPAVIRESPIEEPASWGAALTMGANADVARGGELPRNTYAVFDSARRARLVTPSTRPATLRRRSGPGTPQSPPQTPTSPSMR